MRTIMDRCGVVLLSEGVMQRVGCILLLSWAIVSCESRPREPAVESRAAVATPAIATTQTAITALSTTQSYPAITSVVTTTEANALSRLEFEQLPVVATPKCKYGARNTWVTAPHTQWTPIVESVVRAWDPGEGYAPNSCVHFVRTHCAPDLDGQPGDEVIAEVRYRVPPMVTGDVTSIALSCSSKQRPDKGILVVLSPPSDPPPNEQHTAWVFKAWLGWTITGPEVEGGYSLAINHFVQLPNRGNGVFVHAINPGFLEEFEQVLGLERGGTWFRTLASRAVPSERRRQRE